MPQDWIEFTSKDRQNIETKNTTNYSTEVIKTKKIIERKSERMENKKKLHNIIKN